MKTIHSSTYIILLSMAAMLTISCGGGSQSSTDANQSPTANAGTDQSVETGTLVNLTGAASSDADGDTLSYSWKLQAIPAGSTASLSNSTTIAPSFIADLAGNYNVNLVVNDGQEDSNTDSVSITAMATNRAPVADAGIDQSVETGTLVSLSGTGSSDLDGDILNYSWNLQVIPSGSTASLSNSLAAAPNFTADLAGDYIVNLVVNDGQTDSNTDSVTITVTTTIVVPTMNLNDTGVDWGGNYMSGNNSSCIGQTISEQDCSHGRDAQAVAGTLTKVGAGHAGFDFTKLDVNGNELPENSSNWSCVKDNHTGLIWEVKTNDGGIHDKDNTYRWGGLTTLLTGPYGTQYSDWDTLVDGSNNEVLCGFSDWRVPSREELRSIVNYSQSNPSIDFNFFPNTVADFYWTASSDAFNSDNAFSINFFTGTDITFPRAGNSSYPNGFTARLVRGD